MLQSMEVCKIHNSLPPEMFEAVIEPYLIERQQKELAAIYRFIIKTALDDNNLLLVDKTCSWMFHEVEEGGLSSETVTTIYSELLVKISKDELVASLFAQTAIEA